MSVPVLLGGCLSLHLHLMTHSFVVVFLVYSCYDIEIFIILSSQELLGLFHGQSHLSLLEVKIRQLLVVNHVVCVSDWPHLLLLLLGLVLVVGMQVHDVEVFLVLGCVFLLDYSLTRWLTSDLALFDYIP